MRYLLITLWCLWLFPSLIQAKVVILTAGVDKCSPTVKENLQDTFRSLATILGNAPRQPFDMPDPDMGETEFMQSVLEGAHYFTAYKAELQSVATDLSEVDRISDDEETVTITCGGNPRASSPSLIDTLFGMPPSSRYEMNRKDRDTPSGNPKFNELVYYLIMLKHPELDVKLAKTLGDGSPATQMPNDLVNEPITKNLSNLMLYQILAYIVAADPDGFPLSIRRRPDSHLWTRGGGNHLSGHSSVFSQWTDVVVGSPTTQNSESRPGSRASTLNSDASRFPWEIPSTTLGSATRFTSGSATRPTTPDPKTHQLPHKNSFPSAGGILNLLKPNPSLHGLKPPQQGVHLGFPPSPKAPKAPSALSRLRSKITPKPKVPPAVKPNSPPSSSLFGRIKNKISSSKPKVRRELGPTTPPSVLSAQPTSPELTAFPKTGSSLRRRTSNVPQRRTMQRDMVRKRKLPLNDA